METPAAAPPLIVAAQDGILRLTLNRPAVRNAINHEIVAALTSAFQNAATDPDVRVVALTATGRVFCSGADLSRLQGLATAPRDASIADATAHLHMLRAIVTCPKPVIAAVQGSAHGAAVSLVSACDVVLATASCRFAVGEARLGLAPILVAPYLAAAIGPRATRFHLLTGTPIEATDAHRLGLVHRVVPDDDLESALAETAAAIIRGGPVALAAAKRALARPTLPLDDAAIAVIANQTADARDGAEAREGVAAFLEKRAPIWPATP